MMTYTFNNQDNVETTIMKIADCMLGGQYDDNQRVKNAKAAQIARTLDGDGGAYGEPVYVRTTDATPMLLGFQEACALLGGHKVN